MGAVYVTTANLCQDSVVDEELVGEIGEVVGSWTKAMTSGANIKSGLKNFGAEDVGRPEYVVQT